MGGSDFKIASWFIAGTVVVLLAPDLPVLADYLTFIHPWRAELAGSVLLILLLAAAYGNADFRKFTAGMPGNEFRLLVLPCVAFIVWSGLSAVWARSPAFAAYHTSGWAGYLAFYALFRYYTREDGAVDRWIVGIMVFLWILSVPALVQYFAHLGSSEPSTLGLRYSKYTELANCVVPLVAAYALKREGTTALFGYATVILVWLFDNASLSRTGVGMFVIESVVLVSLTLVIPSFRSYRLKTAMLSAALMAVTVISGIALTASSGSHSVIDRAVDPASYDSSNVRPFFAGIALQMWRENKVLGVGADNFGLEFNPSRRMYVQRVPDDPLLRLADDDLPERAHNEYVQILAELGIVGLAIFAVFLFGVAACATYLWRARTEISLNTAAALVGLGAFLASSLVTSYSFRVFQNGIAFFFVLAIAVAGSLGKRSETDNLHISERRSLVAGYAVLLAIITSVLLGGYCLLRLAAVYEMQAAVGSKNAPERNRHFENAIMRDPNNAFIYRSAGLARLDQNDAAGAAALFRQAIDHGLGSSVEYSYLATAQLVGIGTEAASQTIDEALALFPRSVFLHVRSGILLKMLGKAAESDRQFQIANELDADQAATWRVFIESGAAVASKFSLNLNGRPLNSLRPANCLAAVQKEREILHPQEKMATPQ